MAWIFRLRTSCESFFRFRSEVSAAWIPKSSSLHETSQFFLLSLHSFSQARIVRTWKAFVANS
jgi:hypothetical protein